MPLILSSIETRKTDPQFQLLSSSSSVPARQLRKNPAEMEKLTAAREAAATLYTRWEALQAIADAEVPSVP